MSNPVPFVEEPVRKVRVDVESILAVEEPPKSTWKGKIWDTFDRPPLERKLLFKVDAIILTFASIGYFLKNLDQTNVSNAFLTGMKEDLGMYGNQLVTSTSIWTVGYVIGQLPSNLLLTRVEPRWVLPALELGWGIATLGSYAVKSYKSLYALRFLVGVFESGFYPGMHYLLGSWYTPAEIGKRAMIFWLAGSLGQMFSGLLQAAASRNLDGVHGIEGWRWLFIIDAIITLPLAIAGFIFFPPQPLQGKKTWWLSDEEFALAQRRLTKIGRAGKSPWSLEKVKRLLLSWHTYFLPVLYIIWNNQWPQAPVGYYLKSFNSAPYPGGDKRYSTSDINQLPLPQTAIFVVVAASWAWVSDGFLRGNRWIFVYIGAIISIIIGVIGIKIDLYANVTGTLFFYWFSNIGQGAGPLILTFINEICSDDTEKRALLVGAANDFAYVVQAIVPNFVWKTVDFPQARKGWTYSVSLNVALIFWITAILVLLRRDRRRAESAENPPALEGKDHLEGFGALSESGSSDRDGVPRLNGKEEEEGATTPGSLTGSLDQKY
ncbi:pantothenate transporter [Cryptococcus wingfieldii CBS 7118]|uniref:Pantothenate transporter n=1 Tax=Cryptococcus wingfieldii CBS 7118 TaxID=1295528 RepID=A0A1E3IFY9_9TREE|nr:pantothenate transporter [Cryptococcus wingfieldii CBS 7118]ODN86836.1 pantothenate transporter [Cryptococcus wingfieldii CBS 7118]